MYCKYCGSRIEDDAKFCPSCGRFIKEEVQAEFVSEYGKTKTQSENSTVDNYALIGFILGLCTYVVGFTCIPGLIFSILGKNSIKNRGMAIAGIVLSIIPIVICIIVLLIVLIVFSVAAANGALCVMFL